MIVSVVSEQKELRLAGFALLTLIFFASVMRFFNVETSPPGFYRDEAAISAQVICVQQSGANIQHQKWPLFSPVLAGGFVTPAFLYPAAAWTTIFGIEIASFREFAAFFSLLFIFGTYIFGSRFWKSREAGAFCALSAAISPWVFQFARIAWDPSVAPAYMAWGFAFLWGRRNWELALSGVCFSLAAYSYPPLRLHLALMMPFAVVLLARERRDWKPYVIPILSATLVSLPLLRLTFSGELQKRFAILSIFNSEHLQDVFGDSSRLHAIQLFFENLFSLLSPGYLFVHGDINLRHSTRMLGIWSWLDTFAFFLAIAWSLSRLSKKTSLPVAQIAFVVVGYLAGLLPSALTWEGNPHALRSFSAATFLVLGVGGVLSRAWNQSRALRNTILALAFVSFLVFTQVYFVAYPRIARGPFDASISEAAEQLRKENRSGELREILQSSGVSYDSMSLSYYALLSGVEACSAKAQPEKN